MEQISHNKWDIRIWWSVSWIQYFDESTRSKMSCCLSFGLGVWLQPSLWPVIMDRPWSCVVSRFSSGSLEHMLYAVMSLSPGWAFTSCYIALSSAWSLALSAFAPGWFPWNEPGFCSSPTYLCLLMDPITNTWLCLVSSVHIGLGPVGEDTAPGGVTLGSWFVHFWGAALLLLFLDAHISSCIFLEGLEVQRRVMSVIVKHRIQVKIKVQSGHRVSCDTPSKKAICGTAVLKDNWLTTV